MGLLGNTFNSIYNAVFGSGSNRNDQFNFISQDLAKSSAGRVVKAENALQNATVLGCVSVIAKTIAQLKYGVHQVSDGKTVYLPNHRLQPVLYRPNPLQSAYDFKLGLIMDLMVYGNAFIRIERKNGVIVALYPVAPRDVQVAANPAGYPRYRLEGFGEELGKDAMVHIKDIAGHDITSQSRVILAASRVGALNAADKFIGNSFDNGINANYAITIEGAALDEVKRKAIQENIRESLNSLNGKSNAFLLENGKITTLGGMKPADVDMRELRDDLINEICGIFQVPASMIGGKSDEKYSNVTAKYTSFYRDTINPIKTNVEEALNYCLLDNVPNQKIMFDSTELIKGDLGTQITFVEKAIASGVMTQNEGRAYLGWDTMEGEGYDELGKPNSTTEEIETSGPASNSDEGNAVEDAND